MTTSIQTIERGTIYWGTVFAYRKKEARKITFQEAPFAQFAAAIIVTFTAKGRRKQSQLRLTSGRLVVLDGWGHTTPPGIYDAGRPLPGDSNVTIHGTRYSMSDPRWHSEFDAWFADYMASSGATIAADYRKHDFKDTTGPHVYPRDLTLDMPVLIFGTKNGEVVPRAQWERDYAPKEEFANLAEAQKIYPDLSMQLTPKSRFAGPTVDKRRGKVWTRFDTQEHWTKIMTD